MYGIESLKEVLLNWEIVPRTLHRNCIISGSPERTEYRIVIEDDKGDKYLLENFLESQKEVKERIQKVLKHLTLRGVGGINPYILSVKGNDFILYGNRLWQLSPFIEGIDLNRREYFKERWRGELLGEFIGALGDISHELESLFVGEKPFSLWNYILELFEKINSFKPYIANDVKGFIDYLEKHFLSSLSTMANSFSHGDLHPINVIWGEKNINAIIDWEFTGFKPHIYDLANLVGCLGVEHPSALKGEMVQGVLLSLRRKGLQDEAIEALPNFILAQRFAWLSEWLRKRDQAMLKMELDYMGLLKDYGDDLKDFWLSL